MQKILVLILTISISACCYSQFAFGLSANYRCSLGFNENWKFDTDNLKMNSKNSHDLGGGLFIRGGKTVFVQPELTYNFTLAKINVQVNDNQSTTIDLKLNTINIPVLLGWKVVDTDFFNLRLMAGPHFRFNINSKDDLSQLSDVNAALRKWQMGLNTGLGFDLGKFTIDLRYNLIQDMYNYTYGSLAVHINKSPINSFSVGLGFKFVDIKR